MRPIKLHVKIARNNNTSRNTSSYLKDETHQTSRKDCNVPETRESPNAKGIRKRGRPRKSSTDASASSKPKKSKSSLNDESLNPIQEIPPNVHATQYSSSSKPTSKNTPTDLEVKLTQQIEIDKRSNEATLVKSNSLAEISAPDKQRQFSRTYSTGCTPSPIDGSFISNNTSVPSFTLTYPLIDSSTRPEIKSKKVNKTEKSSSHIEIQRPKLKKYSQGEKTNNGHESNNGFPFTITNILEKQLTTTKQTMPFNETANEKGLSAGYVQVQNAVHQEAESIKIHSLNGKTMSNIEKNYNTNLSSDKTANPTVSWTMNVVAPKVNVSEEIDEDYDA